MSVSYGGDSITFADGSIVSSGYSSGNKNLVHNGAMEIDQRNQGAANTPSNYMVTMDRWVCRTSGSGKYIIQQKDGINSGASNYESGAAPAGFNSSMKITSNSAFSMGASDYGFITQYFERGMANGLDYGLSTGKSLTLSFWTKCSLTGTFSIAIRGSSYQYISSYTINQSNVWEYKTITIPPPPVGSTWGFHPSPYFELDFTLGVGANYQGTNNTWYNGSVLNAIGVTGATNFLGTNGATMYLTGVQLERGSTASSFEYRSHQQEMAICQRYFVSNQTETLVYPYINAGNAVNVGYAHWMLPVEMRTQPTVTWSTQNITSPATRTASSRQVSFLANGVSGGNGTGYINSWKAEAEF